MSIDQKSALVHPQNHLEVYLFLQFKLKKNLLKIETIITPCYRPTVSLYKYIICFSFFCQGN